MTRSTKTQFFKLREGLMVSIIDRIIINYCFCLDEIEKNDALEYLGKKIIGLNSPDYLEFQKYALETLSEYKDLVE